MGAGKLDRRVADRYRLPEGDRDGRYSKYPVRYIQRAEIFDVSYSGVAFRISAEKAPEIGEVIAVEFRLPGSRKMAWYAQVVRLEVEHVQVSQDGENGIAAHPATVIVKVGAKFFEIPVLRRKQLERHIDTLLEQVQGDQAHRVTILSEALRVQRAHEASAWRYIRTLFIVGLALLGAYYFLSYINSVGSRELRVSHERIWPGYKDHKPEALPPDWPEARKPAKSEPLDK